VGEGYLEEAPAASRPIRAQAVFEAVLGTVTLALRIAVGDGQFAPAARWPPAWAVERYGTQNHRYTLDEFRERYRESFGEEPPL
jgi:hypothetical protein